MNQVPSPDRPTRPHVVLIMCDQLRADALGFMGNAVVQTPNLDRLAARGMIFDQMHVQSSVCIPSRAAILTGRYPRALRMSGGSSLLDPREVTLPECFQRAGYRTGLFGKLHLTPQQYTFKDLKTSHAICDAQPFLEAACIPKLVDDPMKRNFGFQTVVSHEDTLNGDYVQWLSKRDSELAASMPLWPERGGSTDLTSSRNPDPVFMRESSRQ